jgi:mannose-binding lectin 2
LHEKSLKVDVQHEPDKWTLCFTLPNVKIPAVAYLGFSAETGELADNHDIINVETRNLYAPEVGKGGGGAADIGKNSSPKSRKGRDRNSGGWLWLFIKFCLFGFLVVGVYAGVTAYRSNKYRSRF